MMIMSFRERFLGMPNSINGGHYAPSTIGAPVFIEPVDYSVFKKTKDEKMEYKIAKSLHKKQLMKAYPNGIGRKLNIPSKSLSEAVINQF